MFLTERLALPTLLAASLLASAPAVAPSASKSEPLVIQDQGSFMVGGTVITVRRAEAARAGRADLPGHHLDAFHQVPVSPRKYPIVMWHGAGQCSKTWETTPDGREGRASA
jgi:hypothetical protein